jgi:hypothetical protein
MNIVGPHSIAIQLRVLRLNALPWINPANTCSIIRKQFPPKRNVAAQLIQQSTADSKNSSSLL